MFHERLPGVLAAAEHAVDEDSSQQVCALVIILILHFDSLQFTQLTDITQIKRFDSLELTLFHEGVAGNREYRKWLQGTCDKLLPSPSVAARKRKRSHTS